jgi:cytosine/uracil/thiamine/allantoin permease
VAIYITDYLMRRGRYDSPSLMQTGRGLYFRNGGVHIPGIVAQLIGMLAAASWLNAYPSWTSPLTNHTGGADFSVFMGALFGGGIYFLLARRGVAKEADESVTEETLTAPAPAS